jgi:hypothetical protein
MSVQPTEESLPVLQEDTSSDRESFGGVCAGCYELTERVERLEQKLAAHSEEVSLPTLDTTRCYWICIAVHALVMFCLFSNEDAVSFGGLALCGATGTLMVCHVFSTHAIHAKILRSLLSISVVAVASILAMGMADMSDPEELLALIWVFSPFLFTSGWLVAKVVVWSRGWRIVPPNHASEFPKLHISHLLLCTFLVAAYLAIGRVLIGDNEDLLGAEMAISALYIALPTSVCTFFACALARIIMGPDRHNLYKRVTLLAIAAFLTSGAAYTLLAIFSGESDPEVFMLLAILSLQTTVGVFASSCFTFLMLRIAKYRLALPAG